MEGHFPGGKINYRHQGGEKIAILQYLSQKISIDDLKSTGHPCGSPLMFVLTIYRLTFPTKKFWIHLCRSVAARPSPWWTVPGRGLTVWPEAEPSVNPGADGHTHIHSHTHTYTYLMGQHWDRLTVKQSDIGAGSMALDSLQNVQSSKAERLRWTNQTWPAVVVLQH